MTASESQIMQEIRLALSRGATRLFRNSVSVGWIGQVVHRGKDTITLKNPRVLRGGLFPGSGDCIGWHTITIGPEHIGQRLAVFCSVEVKTPTGRVEPHQQAWAEAVTQAGGIAGVARSVDEAREILGK